jgi:1,4-dihydroxy-2-naphthoyl-CoA synthase
MDVEALRTARPWVGSVAGAMEGRNAFVEKRAVDFAKFRA